MSAATILLVDPDEQDRQLVRGLLQELGYEVTACADPRAALVTLAAQPHDLVITAYPLPTTAGGDFIQAIRRIASVTPVMGMIRRGMREVARDALTHGCKEFVSKPVDPELLAGLIPTLLATPCDPPVPTREAEAPAAELRSDPPLRSDVARADGETGRDPKAGKGEAPEIPPQ